MLERKTPPCTDTFGDSWAGGIGLQDGLLRISEAMEVRNFMSTLSLCKSSAVLHRK